MYNNNALTITFCDQGENHIGNQKIGKLADNGFTYDELKSFQERLALHQIRSELIDLGEYLPKEYATEKAGLLIIKNGINIFVSPPELLWDELITLNYDKHALMYGQVRNKIARHNLCFHDINQAANYEKGYGTIVSFNDLGCLSHVRKYLPILFNEKATNLVAEANKYYDVNKCGIGYHGDAERKIVIGLRLGASFPLTYYWYMGKNRISQRVTINLDHGDLYVMDEKACGFDYKRRNIPTLRHAAGCDKYIK